MISPLSSCFNPRAPWGARLAFGETGMAYITFQSTRPLGGATSGILRVHLQMKVVSIHAPPGGRDYGATMQPALPCLGFNPRAPWGARPGPPRRSRPLPRCFNPRAPWGARQAHLAGLVHYLDVSIHAPPGGRDGTPKSRPFRQRGFQSTRPLGGATPRLSDLPGPLISFNPRAPWGARPRCGARRPHPIPCFNPRAPWGARR